MKAEVTVVEPLGLSTQFYANLGTQEICILAMGRPTVKPGDIVTLSADPLNLHMFDPESGKRLD